MSKPKWGNRRKKIPLFAHRRVLRYNTRSKRKLRFFVFLRRLFKLSPLEIDQSLGDNPPLTLLLPLLWEFPRYRAALVLQVINGIPLEIPLDNEGETWVKNTANNHDKIVAMRWWKQHVTRAGMALMTPLYAKAFVNSDKVDKTWLSK